MNTSKMLTCAATLTLLAACGGGSDPAPVANADEVPAAASASPAGMAGWLNGLATSEATAAAEWKEPLAATAFNPVTSDTTEPETVR
jgi:hypothetical protein